MSRIRMLGHGSVFLCRLIIVFLLGTRIGLINQAKASGGEELIPFEDNGQPELDFLRANSFSYNLANASIDKMTKQQLRLTLHSYLDNVNAVCRRTLRMGYTTDGGDKGWEVCDDINVRPTSPCVVYSYGSTETSSFEDDIARVYGCDVFAFDPLNKNALSHQRVGFFDYMIGKETGDKGGMTTYTLEDLRKHLGHIDSPLAVIKIDACAKLNGWSTLQNMIDTHQTVTIRQLLVKFYMSDDHLDARGKLKVLQGLELAGFRKFNTHKDQDCQARVTYFPVTRTSCYEVHFMKI